MLYQGSKSKLSKQILHTLQTHAPDTQLIIEPFLGGANMSVRLATWRPVLAGDACPGLADMHITAQNGFRLPPDGVTREEWARLKALSLAGDHSPYVLATGFALSFAGGFYRGYASGADPRKTRFAAFYNNFCDRLCKLRDLYIVPGCTVYSDWTAHMTPGVLVYCDPPYRNTCGYAGAPPWNPDQFYSTARVWAAMGARVFVSELDAPFNLVAEYRTGCTPAQCTHALDRDFADRLYEVVV